MSQHDASRPVLSQAEARVIEAWVAHLDECEACRGGALCSQGKHMQAKLDRYRAERTANKPDRRHHG